MVPDSGFVLSLSTMNEENAQYSIHVSGLAQPVVATNVYCIGRNYAAHILELGNSVPSEPIVFLKTVTSLRSLRSGDLAHEHETFHHEAELVLLIGKPVPRGRSAGWDAVQGLGLGIDLTRREVQTALKAKGLPWAAAKSFAGAGLLSDFIVPSELPDLSSITFAFSVNGTLRQHGDSALMLNPVPALLTHIAQTNRLIPGDLIFTGTPAGVGPMRQGDHFTLEFLQIAKRFDGRL